MQWLQSAALCLGFLLSFLLGAWVATLGAERQRRRKRPYIDLHR